MCQPSYRKLSFEMHWCTILRWRVQCTSQNHHFHSWCNRNLTLQGSGDADQWIFLRYYHFVHFCWYALVQHIWMSGAVHHCVSGASRPGADTWCWCTRPEAVVRPRETVGCCNSCRVPPSAPTSSSSNTGWLGGKLACTRSWGRAAQLGSFHQSRSNCSCTMTLRTRSKCTNSLKSILLKTLLIWVIEPKMAGGYSTESARRALPNGNGANYSQLVEEGRGEVAEHINQFLTIEYILENLSISSKIGLGDTFKFFV